LDPKACRGLPHGLFAISKNVRAPAVHFDLKEEGTNYEGFDYSWLEGFPVVKRIGYSIDVYDLDRPLTPAARVPQYDPPPWER
jgi:hypothetical protein